MEKPAYVKIFEDLPEDCKRHFLEGSWDIKENQMKGSDTLDASLNNRDGENIS